MNELYNYDCYCVTLKYVVLCHLSMNLSLLYDFVNSCIVPHTFHFSKKLHLLVSHQSYQKVFMY